MKYFLDTEFIEGDIPVKIAGFSIPKWLISPNNTIELISIALVSSDNREYYAISKDFNLKEAWDRHEWKQTTINDDVSGEYKTHWIRNNVLKPIWEELLKNAMKDIRIYRRCCLYTSLEKSDMDFNYHNFKKLIKRYGKSNKQIAKEICDFIDIRDCENGKIIIPGGASIKQVMSNDTQFYGYYSDYDWVAFSWLFGKIINLPKWFPTYCIDLKQTLDEKENFLVFRSDKWAITDIKKLPGYPEQHRIHNALVDAKWSFELYKFLITL